ncbi:helix-turn-helix domain-containing protein [Bacillus inaquosorum]|uniref:helix-turn-helix domain-containing protein n=1 Tax=Bacillus inaquosorum TaxID=483913 RepID=UPI002280A6D7|nr:helix-turn-helix transcriptional regulator [Bacillus inaquosorum]MCY9178067.1 helix-turn-helix transcriptional regulator [Bacillus inaquosorum]
MLASRLKYLRNKHKKTQQDLAVLLGISRQGYAKYENGLGEPDNSTLVKLADFYEVSTDYLLGRTDITEASLYTQNIFEFPTFANTPELNTFYKELPTFDEEGVKRLMKIWEIIKKDFKK